jgi:hypothetical protein
MTPPSSFRYVMKRSGKIRFRNLRKRKYDSIWVGSKKIAFVPLFIVDEANQTVQAALLGERGDMILVSFPPTNFGQTRFLSDEDSLMRIARPLVESQG